MITYTQGLFNIVLPSNLKQFWLHCYWSGVVHDFHFINLVDKLIDNSRSLLQLRRQLLVLIPRLEEHNGKESIQEAQGQHRLLVGKAGEAREA